MSNYWPVIMWMSEVKDDTFVFIPSQAHHHINRLGPYRSWRDAMQAIMNRKLEITRRETAFVPLFWPCVLEQIKQPDRVTLRLIVRRISLREGDNEGYSGE